MNRLKFAAALVCMAVLSATPLLADDTVTLKSADGQYQFVVPAGWESADFHVDSVQIGATNKHLGEYAEVVAERLEDYVNSLTQYAEGKRDVMAMSLDNPVLTAGTALKINGRDAMQFEVHGQLPGSDIRIGYLLTVMKTKTHYIQVIGWTIDSHFADNRTELEGLANGFSETSKNSKSN